MIILSITGHTGIKTLTYSHSFVCLCIRIMDFIHTFFRHSKNKNIEANYSVTKQTFIVKKQNHRRFSNLLGSVKKIENEKYNAIHEFTAQTNDLSSEHVERKN